jgi:hypothetical protein
MGEDTRPAIAWVLTKSDQYYPCGGTSDWKKVFTDAEEAVAAFIKQPHTADQSVYLIAIFPNGEFREVDYK